MVYSTGKPTRRQFFQTTIAVLAAPAVVPATALGQGKDAPSERICMGVVGLGSRGFDLLRQFIQQSDTQIVAVCDVDALHYRDNPWGEGHAYGREAAQKSIEAYYAKQAGTSTYSGLTVYSDFRELCARDDLDAVVVGTPDHWHALCSLEALRQGKDVYCEKPVTHLFHEGQTVYREAARRKAVFQAGSQQRSDWGFHRAVELVRNGHIGPVQRVEVGLPPGYSKPQGDTTVQPPPDHLDYDFWCGPSPVLPYMRARHHRWWRGHRNYGGGVLMDWIGHHNDIAHWGLGQDKGGPVKVEAVGWIYPETDIYNTPWQYEIHCEYKGGITSTISSKNTGGTKWIGEDGWVYVDRGKLETSDPRWKERDFDPGSIKAYNSPNHARNFLDCIRSRQPCIAPAETAHRSVTPGHLGYVSHTLGRALRWDPVHETVVDDTEANTLLQTVDYREPWILREA